jgi:acetyl esterase/lipase
LTQSIGRAYVTVMNQIDFVELLNHSQLATHTETAVYGVESPSQFGQIWRPAGDGPYPAIMFLHGGCWSSAFDLAHARGFCQALAEWGFLVWLPEYRRVGEVGGGWPGTFLDVTEAAQWFWTTWGGQIDPDRRFLAGHSAGAHLALWLNGGSPGLASNVQDAAKPWRQVLAFAPITDLERYSQGRASCQLMASALLASAGGVRAASLSPRPTQMVAGVTVFYSALDVIVPAEQCLVFAAASGCELIEMPQAGHFDFVHPETDAGRAVIKFFKGLSDGS